MDNDESVIRNAVESALGFDAHQQLILRSDIQTAHGRHLQYEHRLDGRTILFSGLNVHIYPHATVYQDYLLPLDGLHVQEGAGTYLMETDGLLIPLTRRMNNEIERPVWTFRAQDGTEWFQAERYRYLEDTVAQLGVFQVNPVNSANSTYGGPFIDNKDSNNIILQSQIDTVSFGVSYRNDSFFLEHPKIQLGEISAPYYYDSYGSPTDSFLYTRDQQRFEAVNAFYHIGSFVAYLDSLGYGSLSLPVEVDVHALNGSDNSQFDPQDYTIEFGDGGVDDAEDGEVLIHEYVHSISTTAHYTVNNSKERDAMEEGNCDYLSKSYSRSVNDHNSYKVFSWDGHNAFWSGFIINSTDHYPEDLRNTKDGDRDIWSSTLMCIHDAIGREATDSLVLEHLFYQQPKATMAEMADVLLLVDSLIFNRRHYGPIKECLVARGLTSYGVGIRDWNSHRQLRWINSFGFSQGTEPMELRMGLPFRYSIHNSLGQEIMQGHASSDLVLDPGQFPKGYYTVLVQTDNGIWTGRFVR